MWAGSHTQPWPVRERADWAWGSPSSDSPWCPDPAELQAQHGLRTFRLARTCCYEALLVDEERGRLFVGAENHVASLSLDNISKRAKKVPGTPRLGAAQGRSPGTPSRLPGETRGGPPPPAPAQREAPDRCSPFPNPP